MGFIIDRVLKSLLTDAKDDVDEGGDIGDIHTAIAIHIGTGLVHGSQAQNHVDESGHIAHIHAAVAVHIAHDGFYWLHIRFAHIKLILRIAIAQAVLIDIAVVVVDRLHLEPGTHRRIGSITA